MKITELHIYGYGKLSNLKMQNLQDFQVFYGENEAGKSTIMSFIHSILFGFPSKQQSELRYEPKLGEKYGGQLTINFSKGRVVIERIKGKASGDVTVTFEDGTRGGEELLKELLMNIDKNLYQSIFSFNIHGLQNIHQLKGEDIGRFLFSAGALGTDQLVLAENTLLKELESRFKPNGKKPSLNLKLKELKHLHAELKKAEKQNEQYWILIKEKERLETELEETQSQQSLLIIKQSNLEGLRSILPIKQEESVLKIELQNYKDLIFPVDGLLRLERLEEMMKPLEGQLAGLTKRLTSLRDEMEHSYPNKELLNKEHEILAAVESVSLLEKMKQEEKEIHNKIVRLEQEMFMVSEKLHLPIDEEQLSAANTSVFMKEKIRAAQENYRRLQAKKQHLDDQFLHEKQWLERIEEEMEECDKQLHLTQSIEKKRQHQQIRQDRIQFALFFTLFACLFAWGMMDKTLILAVISVVGALVSLYLFTTRQASDSDGDARHQRSKELSEELHRIQTKWADQNARYEKVLAEFEAWEMLMVNAQNEMHILGEEFALPKEYVFSHLGDGFELMEQLKKLNHEKKMAMDCLQSNTEKMKQTSQAIEKLGLQFLKESYASIQDIAFILREKWKEETEKSVLFIEKKAKYIELEDELERVRLEWVHFQAEKEHLFHLANVENEEDFRKKGLEDKKKRALHEQLMLVQRQLKISPNPYAMEFEEFENLAELDQRIIYESEHLDRLSKTIPLLQSQLAEKKYEIQLLEEGGTYTELLHLYELKKSEVEDEARVWAKFAMAKEMLDQTIDRFKSERLPLMLEKAEEYLNDLTEGHYIHIYPKQEGSGFFIERKDHCVFEANELSQATAEQVYVAFRLALAETIYEKYPFPIIIDDSFVNFDHKRTKKIMTLLKKLKNRQILFFTCHPHVLHHFTNQQILNVNKEEKLPIMSDVIY